MSINIIVHLCYVFRPFLCAGNLVEVPRRLKTPRLVHRPSKMPRWPLRPMKTKSRLPRKARPHRNRQAVKHLRNSCQVEARARVTIPVLLRHQVSSCQAGSSCQAPNRYYECRSFILSSQSKCSHSVTRSALKN